MTDLSGIYVNTLAFQPTGSQEFILPSGQTFVPSNISGTTPLYLNDPQLGGGFGIPSNQTSGFLPNAFGPSIVVGPNTANLNTPIVPVSNGPATSLGPLPDASNSNGDSFSFNDPNSITLPDVFVGAQPDNVATQGSGVNASTTGTTDLPGSIGQSLGLPDWLTNPNNPITSIFNGIGGTNLPTSGTASGNAFYQGVLNNVQDFIVRFGLILLAIALIAVAAWALSKGGLQKQAAKLVGG